MSSSSVSAGPAASSSKELTEAGLKVVALERGAMRTTANDYSLPNIRDELRYVVRHDLMMNTARDTLTSATIPRRRRCRCGGSARSCRARWSAAPACTGAATPGAGPTWSSRSAPMYEERYGKNFIPDDMTIQDWGITYAELEPYYDKFEYTAAVSGKAGNLRGQIQAGGNPFEAPRAREYPLPPLTPILASEMFTEAAEQRRLSSVPAAVGERLAAPTPIPTASKFGACQYCGYCQRFGCEANAKGSPHMTRDPDRDAQSEFRAAHAFLGHQGAQGFRRQARHRRHLHQRAQRRGIRAAGRPSCCCAPMRSTMCT